MIALALSLLILVPQGQEATLKVNGPSPGTVRLGESSVIELVIEGQISGVGNLEVPEETSSVTASPGSGPSVHLSKEMNQKPVHAFTRIVTENYIIGPEDVLEISVWRNQDLSKEVIVRPDGRVSLPLLGDVVAVGKTPMQLTQDISERLEKYKQNPSVAIIVKAVNSYAVFVLGEVKAPGKYPLKSKTTLLQGITMAGGFTEVAARNKVVIFRFGENGEGEQKITASYDDIVLRDGVEQNIELKPGDTIVVPSETMVLIP